MEAMGPTPQISSSTQVATMATLFFFYLIAASIALAIHPADTFVPIIWPSSGIAIAVLLLYGYYVWPSIFFGAFLVYISIGLPPLPALVMATGNTIGSLLGTVFIEWYSGYHPSKFRLLDNIGLVIVAIIVPVITATVTVGSLWFTSMTTHPLGHATWNMLWIADVLGILILTPFILRWINQPFFERNWRQKIELILVLLTVAATSFVIFWLPQTYFAYYVFIPLTWATLRTGPRGMTLSIVIASAIAIAGTLAGHGPFVEQGFQYLQIFIATVDGMFLIFSAIVEEHRRVREVAEKHAHELESALHKISAEDEAKKEFLAVLAHELRNPLATILSSIELLNLEGVEGSHTTTFLRTIEERARAMVRLLEDLLDISRISHKKLKLQKETVAVDQFIDKLARTVQPLVRHFGHTLSITKPDQELFLDADPVRIEQIFVNLITNAAKYTEAHGSIELSVNKEDRMAVIRVRDSGVGIPKNMLRRVFEPFFQVQRGESRGEGLGVGLPLTRELVEQHRGTIEARSAGSNTGSEFIVRLPLVEPVKEELSLVTDLTSHDQHMQAQDAARRKFSILVVDDNEAATEALARLLQLRGHITARAYRGSEAIQKALTFKPEVVLLDIGLPDMDGYEVANILRHHEKSYVLVALTGYGQVEDKERAKQVGFHYHLTKPAGLKEIESVLRTISFENS